MGWVVVMVVVAVGLFALNGSAASGQESKATLAFSPPPQAIAAGQHATYVLGIANATRLFGADIELSFDPKVVAVVDADPAKDGVQVKLGPFLDPGFVVYNLADNATGKLRVTFTQVAPSSACHTDRAPYSPSRSTRSAGGDPKLRITAALLARDDGTEQPVTIPVAGNANAGAAAKVHQRRTQREIPECQPGLPARPLSVATTATVATRNHRRRSSDRHAGVGRGSDLKGKTARTNDNSSACGGGLLGAGVLTGAAVVVGRKYLKRNGESK